MRVWRKSLVCGIRCCRVKELYRNLTNNNTTPFKFVEVTKSFLLLLIEGVDRGGRNDKDNKNQRSLISEGWYSIFYCLWRALFLFNFGFISIAKKDEQLREQKK